MQVRQQVRYWDRSSIHWIFNGEFHRDGDLPAKYYFTDGQLDFVSYRQHHKLHRTTGPAYISYKGKNKWYYYQGREYASFEEMLMMEACR